MQPSIKPVPARPADGAQPEPAAADPLATISEQLAEQLAWLSKISRQLDDLASALHDAETRRVSGDLAFAAEAEAVPRLPGRWTRLGQLVWRMAYRLERTVSLPHGLRARLLSLFYVPYGALFPRSPQLDAHLRHALKKRTGALLPVHGSAVAPAVATGPRPFDVFIFPVIDWSFRHQRPQHLAEQLARRGHRVFYFATTFVPPHEYKFEAQVVAENVYVVVLPCPGKTPTIYENQLTAHQATAVVAGIESLRERVESTSSLSIIHHPFWWPVANRLSNNRVVYDCLDHHGGFSNTTARMLELETALLVGAELVVTASERLSMRHAAYVRRSSVIRNAADVDHFSRETSRRGPTGRPVVGYFGAIAEWFDVDLVAAAARALPECDFVLIGATVGANVQALERLTNVRLAGEVAYRDLPRYASSFDVCMIPFRINELTLDTNPVKVYEYLSMGKPVVSTRLPEVVLLSEHVRIADTAEEFCRHLRAALGENTATDIERRRAFARQHTWAARVEQFEAAVAVLHPLVSVIVLTHNGLDFTRACLESLDRLTCYPHWELILVDNASSDGTAEYLEEFARSRDYVRVARHAENRGFAAGNNAGAQLARGEYLVFLNNDTYVTRGWLGDLVRHFDRRPDLGILNPVTNNIGNEARIEIAYRNMHEMAAEAARFTRARRGRTLELEVCAFFCVMIPRRVWDDVGELDEQFGLGFFEDDDYARRLKDKGYVLACAEDVFVHHHLSASFDALGEERKRQQFEQNRELFEAKWGAWDPHRYRDRAAAR